MATMTQTTVVGVFHDEQRAQEAVRALRQAGFRENQISVLGQHHDHDGNATDAGDHTGTGALAGAATGAGVAALWSLGITFGVVPVIGPILAAGPIAAALLSAAGGAAAGGIVGALVGMGIPEDEASYYEGEIKSGRVLVTVHADGRDAEAWSILERHGAYRHGTAATENAGSRGTETRATGARGASRSRQATGDRTVEVHEEQLKVQKTPVQAGEVRVRKEVHTEQQNIQVPVEREEVVIERRPASGRASASDIHAGEEVRIPVREEQVNVQKENVVKEEVSVGKRKVQGTQQVSGQVRKEDVKVEQEGNVTTRGTTGGQGRK